MMHDRQTINVLMLELATMVVAIALAFSANFLTAFNFEDVLVFIFSAAVVLWFWWDYVMDRLRYPPISPAFPYLDVLVLILISIIPFALRQNGIEYISLDISFVLIVWALMLSRIIGEGGRVLNEEDRVGIRANVVQRASVGFLLIGDAVLAVYTQFFAALALAFLVSSLMAWSFESRRRRELEAGEMPTGRRSGKAPRV